MVPGRRVKALATGNRGVTMNEDCTIHILFEGRPLCGYRMDLYPGDWPEGHRWVAIEYLDDANCDLCLLAAPMFLPSGRISLDSVSGSAARAKYQAVVAAMRDAITERDDLEHFNDGLKKDVEILKLQQANLTLELQQCRKSQAHTLALLGHAVTQRDKWKRQYEDAVTEYGRHLPDCLLTQGEDDVPSSACTCGFLNALQGVE